MNLGNTCYDSSFYNNPLSLRLSKLGRLDSVLSLWAAQGKELQDSGPQTQVPARGRLTSISYPMTTEMARHYYGRMSRIGLCPFYVFDAFLVAFSYTFLPLRVLL